MRRAVRVVGVAALLTCAACTGDAPTGSDEAATSGARDAATTSTAATAAPVTAVSLTDEEVRDVVTAMDAALQAGDAEAYLRYVAPDLAQEQRAWFEALQAVPMQVRQLRIDGVVSRNDPQGTVVHVGLRHQITGADPEPVLEQYRWVLGADADDQPLLTDVSGRNGAFYGYPQVWDTGKPVAVLEAGSALVLTTEDDRDTAEELLPTLDLAAERSMRDLPRIGEGRDRLAVQLVRKAELADAMDDEGYTAGAVGVILAPDEIPPDAPRLTGRDVRVEQRFLMDVDVAHQDLQDFGESAGGDTSLRYVAAYADAWGDDPRQEVQFWMVEGFPLWFSAVEDEAYAEQLLLTLADHHATVPPPTEIPRGLADAGGLRHRLLGCAEPGHLHLPHIRGGRSARPRRASHPRRRGQADAGAGPGLSEALGADQAALVEDWTQWAEELAQEGEPQVQEGR